MTKSSSSKKIRSVKRHSKMSQMRKKLTLKPRPSPVQCDMGSKEEGRSSAVESKVRVGAEEPNLADEEEAPGVDINDEEQTMALAKAKTKQLLQRASPMKLIRIYKSISEEQKLMIRSADYGGLLDIKCSKLPPDLCKFLMESFDPATCEMVFPGRGTIPVTEASVRKVMGVPRGKLEVRYELHDQGRVLVFCGTLHAGTCFFSCWYFTCN